MMSSQRIVLIGLDGMPYSLVRALTTSGTMPNTQALIDKGTFRPMASSIPEISSVAWSSIITGTNPGQHGIFGFTDLAPGTYRRTYPNFASLKTPPFWEFETAGRSVVLNVPSTYPAREMNGVMIAGFVAPNLQRATFPSTLVPKLEEMNYRVDVDVGRANQSIRLFLDDIERTFRARVDTYRYLWSRETWDTFMLVFTGTDRLAHHLWDAYQDGTHPHHTFFLEHMQQIDEVIGEIVDRLDSDDRLIMLSDHGFETLEKEVYVNYCLREHGLLPFQENTSTRLVDIDERCKAFALDPGRIYLNLQGKYPRGSVLPRDKESFIEDIEALFGSLEIDGQRVIKHVYRKEDIYSGPQMDRAPDLILRAHSGFNLRATINPDCLWDRGHRTGKHAPDAFLLASDSVDPELIPQEPTVEDIVGIMQGSG